MNLINDNMRIFFKGGTGLKFPQQYPWSDEYQLRRGGCRRIESDVVPYDLTYPFASFGGYTFGNGYSGYTTGLCTDDITGGAGV